ncbi:MAG: DUF5684 domain-containing protein [Chloroflexota bacterium]
MNVLALLGPALQRDNGAGAIGGLIGGLFYVVLLVYMIACIWMVFQKAGQPGWHAIIPIWNTIVLLKIAGRPAWWFLLLLVPFLNLVILIMVYLDLGKSFGYGAAFSIFMLLCLAPIGWGMLAFGSARYLGPGGRPQGYWNG